MSLIADFDGQKVEYARKFERLDIGRTIPNDGHRYFMAQHEWVLWGKTRLPNNGTKEAIPAIVNGNWGIKTAVQGDYSFLSDEWLWWFYDFWNHHSGYRLPVGEKVGTYVNPFNPDITYTRYTPGSLKSLYAGMMMDGKAWTDSGSPESGRRDVVCGRNLDARDPVAWLCRPCSGAVMQLRYVNGAKLVMNAIDLYKPPPDISSLEIWQFYFATQVHLDGRVTRFPDVKEEFEVHGYPPAGTAVPMIAPGGTFSIDKAACVELFPGQTWQPYYP
jgi:hypothetical protein